MPRSHATPKRRPIRSAAILLLVAALASPVAADVSLPAVIADHMVLQQQTDVAVWGWAAPGETVSVQAAWQNDAARTVADERGRWLVRIPTPAAGGPHTLTISGHNTIVIRDILVGEVWLASGQSNMEMPLANIRPGYTGVDDAEQEISAATFPRIRLFTVENTRAATPRRDLRGRWAPCSPESARTFSATAYFFGRELHQSLDVPIGLISADWGGTVAQAWMSADGLAPFPGFQPDLERLEAVADPTRRGRYVREAQSHWWDRLGTTADIDPGWAGIDFDDTDWALIDLPATLAGDGLESFDGVVFFRRAVDLPESWSGRPATLDLGPIDDYDDTWVNGRLVGWEHEPNRWNRARRYDVPAGVLRSGRNVVAVRMLDTGGAAGINGEPEMLRLAVADQPPAPLAGSWRYLRGASMSRLSPRPQGAEIHPNTPTVLYNGMIAPLVPYTIRGVIWYQGESNRRNAALYQSLFPALIRNWRETWGQGDFPFYYVQIAPFNYGGDAGETAALRQAQTLALRTPNTGMAVTLDIGDPNDIHPTNKQAVGHRLALWALARTYGHAELVFSGPILESLRIDGGTIRIRFEHRGGGLVLRDVANNPFEVAGADGRFVPAAAALDGDTLLLSSPAVSEPRQARYAWSAAPEAALFNREGLPAAPFQTAR
ncbi:MAG: sialate O-acetylesterase [Planctomycetota bacterium]|jgi:sialate O-acetylesterase